MNELRLKRKETFTLTNGGDSLCGWLHNSTLQTPNQSSLKLGVILFDATSQIRDLSLRPFGAIVPSIAQLWSKAKALLKSSGKYHFGGRFDLSTLGPAGVFPCQKDVNTIQDGNWDCVKHVVRGILINATKSNTTDDLPPPLPTLLTAAPTGWFLCRPCSDNT